MIYYCVAQSVLKARKGKDGLARPNSAVVVTAKGDQKRTFFKEYWTGGYRNVLSLTINDYN